MRKLWKCRRAATAVEYGLIAALVAGAVLLPYQRGGYSILSQTYQQVFDKVFYAGRVIEDPANI